MILKSSQLGKALLAMAAIQIFFAAAANGKRGHVHHHGRGTLDMAADGTLLRANLTLPAHDVLGFEHTPTTNKEKEAVKGARQSLVKGWSQQVKLADSLACQWTIRSAVFPGDHQEKHKHSGHSHADHHSDIQVEAQAQCAKPISGGSVDLSGLFKAFPKVRSLQAQYLDEKQQRGVVLTKKSSLMKFSGSSQ